MIESVTIESLPEWILEEIFSYVRYKMPLRLISKHFKFIVDNSRKLMSNTTLYVSFKAKDTSGDDISSFLQSISIQTLGPKDLDVIKNYKWREYIKSMNLNVTKEELLNSFTLLQSALFGFSKLQEICIEFPSEESEIIWNTKELRTFFGIVKPEFPALQSLDISIYSDVNDILHLFTNSPNLKKLRLNNIGDLTVFIEETEWKLEELRLKLNYVETSVIQSFFDKQSSSLKYLEIFSYARVLNDIVRRLPNLETLRLRRRNDHFFDNKFLISNDKLKELSILDSEMKPRTIEKILLHYNKIERLYIDVHKKVEFNNLILSNLKHITVSWNCPDFLWRLKIENLKSITMFDHWIDSPFLQQIPIENLRNVQVLKAELKLEDISDVLAFFPALIHLCILDGTYVTESVLTDMLKARDLTSISMIKSKWALEKSPTDFLSEIGNDRLVIKFYYEKSEMCGEVEQRILRRHQMAFLPDSDPTTTYEYWEY